MSYWIGIDLGTTNSSLCYRKKGEGESHLFPIKQRVGQAEEKALLTLPSFYLFPPEEPPCVGEFAKMRGEELPNRVVSSAKSWLSHESVDRKSPFLPLSDIAEKISPVDVMAAYLTHLKEAWDKESFVEQDIYITVPASFDPDARLLVQEAAEIAGYPPFTLLEEPTAAFYAWLSCANWRDYLHVNESVLVIDIGGGTTDFTLITVEESEGNLQLTRKAVGSHLLLGGDNLDLTLAHLVRQKLGKSLSRSQMTTLVYASRAAKERLFSGEESVGITLLGEGSRLMGGMLKTLLHREEVEKVLINGFFPYVDLDVEVAHEKRTGLAQLGLPFVRDPRVTAHLAHFLRGHTLPSAVLFHGGTLKAEPFRRAILEVLSSWQGEAVRELPSSDLDFAVSRGAVVYGTGEGIRVRAGSSRSFWIGVEGANPAVPGLEPPLSALCIVPFGLEEGSETVLDEEFTLLLREPALFRFFSRSEDDGSTVGMVCDNPLAELSELHTLETVLESDKNMALVRLKAKLTELGVLELWCVAKDREWKISFEARASAPELVASS
ncbi:MAG: Hsp70 family protein [Chlamydiales bacterium]